ncbi:hypothetical protein HOF78_03865 [Candidatus Woesearchaeota archaeon]|nr:hypothetical protein [Candidatus Woesearchaeota archaeon]MBT6044720.1 hypothetical protein [Candidatus Woesearchaeota archaeon]
MSDEVTAKEAMEKVRSSERKLGLVTVVSLVLLVFIGIFLFNASSSSVDRYYFEYEGIKFNPSKNGVGFDMLFFVNEASFPTLMTVRNDPRTLEDIPIDADYVRGAVAGKSVGYITEDPYDELTGPTLVAANELAIPLIFLYGAEVNKTLTRTSDELGIALEDQVVKTCEDSDDRTLVILQRLGDETAVFEEDGCLVVQGGDSDEMEIIRAADRLYLTMLGIMS